MKVLYVYVGRERLIRLGYTVVVAADGEEGVAVAVRGQPDLILAKIRARLPPERGR